MIDPSIPLQALRTAVQATSPMESYGRALTLKSLLRQGEMDDERIAAARMERAAAEREVFEGQALRDLLGRRPDASESEILSTAPGRGVAFLKGRADARQAATNATKAGVELDLKRIEAEREKYRTLANDAQGLLRLPAEQRAARNRELQLGYVAKGWATADQVTDEVPDEATLQEYVIRGYGIDKALEMQAKEASEKRTAEEHRWKAEKQPLEQAGLAAETEGKQAVAAERWMPDNAQEWPAWRAALDSKLQARIPAEYSPAAAEKVRNMALTRSERAQIDQRGREFAEAKRHNAVMESQGAQRIGMERARAKTEGNPELAKAVMENPALWDGLPPTAKAAIAPQLSAAGFAGFGKPLAESAIVKMSDAKSAIASLRDLRSVLVDNEQYIGPVSGLQALNPWSDAKKAQADIDRVKQRVGKALEGGVLRKEDEEKYKRILATLTDTPSTAIHKVDQLTEDLTRDLDVFVEEQRRAGRRVNAAGGGSGAVAGGAKAVTVVTPDGKSFTFDSAEKAAAFKREAGIR